MSQNHYTTIGENLSKEQGATLGQMFGKPCLKIQNKAFAAFHQEAMVFKLGATSIIGLIEKYPGAQNWDPSGKGRAMKDWLKVPNEFQDDWSTLAEKALAFVIK